MPYKVLLTHDAVNDLEELFTWILRKDCSEAAEHVLAEGPKVANVGLDGARRAPALIR